MVKKYKAIIFDFDDTLVGFDASRKKACDLFWKDWSEDLKQIRQEEFYPLFCRFNDSLWTRYIEGEIWEDLKTLNVLEVSIHKTLEFLGFQSPYLDTMRKSFITTFTRSSQLEEEVENVLQVLSRSYFLGMITNGLEGLQKKRVEISGLSHYFNTVVISGDLGIEKPDPGIFLYCLDKMNLKPSEVLYVGDSLLHDFAGASAVGIDFCYYNPSEKLILTEEEHPKYIINQLSKLLLILD